MPTETTPTNTDIESPPTTPTKKSTRQTRSRLRKNEGSSLAVTEPPPASSDRNHESDDEAEVESTPIARSLTPSVPPSSDDFGGY